MIKKISTYNSLFTCMLLLLSCTEKPPYEDFEKEYKAIVPANATIEDLGVLTHYIEEDEYSFIKDIESDAYTITSFPLYDTLYNYYEPHFDSLVLDSQFFNDNYIIAFNTMIKDEILDYSLVRNDDTLVLKVQFRFHDDAVYCNCKAGALFTFGIK